MTRDQIITTLRTGNVETVEFLDACAEAAELLEEQSKAEHIGRMGDAGVIWFGRNPHAFPIGTEFYTAPPDTEALRQRVKELETEHDEADRRAGAAERMAKHDRDAAIKREWDPDVVFDFPEQASKFISDQSEQIQVAREAIHTAADQIRKCDYTPARSTLLGALTKLGEQ